MTANELLDKLRSVSIKLLGKETEDAGRAILLYRESAIMLRQQAEEIAMLKQIIDANNLQSDIGQFVKLTDSYEKGFIDGMQKQMQSRVQQMVEGYAQLRELTDEEIRQVIDDHWEKTSNVNLFDFARAILKKAQEK